MNNGIETEMENIIENIRYLYISQKNRKSGGKNTNLFGKQYENFTDLKELLLH